MPSENIPPSPLPQAVIPAGIVNRARARIEEQITQDEVFSPPNTDTIISRALQNTNALIGRDRTYASYLSLTEILGLQYLPPHLHSFLADHNNLVAETVASRRLVTPRALSHTNLLDRVNNVLLNIRNEFSLRTVVESRRFTAQTVARVKHEWTQHLLHHAQMLTREILQLLTRLDAADHLAGGDGLMNVGPDHAVGDFGAEVQKCTPGLPGKHEAEEEQGGERCAICLDAYTLPFHTAFAIKKCGHVLGMSCFETWINSTATNANTCPLCRTELFTRRARQPVTMARMAFERQAHETIGEALHMLSLIESLSAGMWARVCTWAHIDEQQAEEERKMLDEVNGYMREQGLRPFTMEEWNNNGRVRDEVDVIRVQDVVMGLNQQLFADDVGYVFIRGHDDYRGWRLWRVDWSSDQLLDEVHN